MGKLLGDKIRQLRKAKKMTLEALATEIGAGKSYVWEIENRDDKNPANPSADRLVAIARALDVTVEFLLDDTSPQPTPEVRDEAFFRMYEKLPSKTKDRLKQIAEAWKDEK
jgi:transcriptional regulator with XRE-family HTH domain